MATNPDRCRHGNAGADGHERSTDQGDQASAHDASLRRQHGFTLTESRGVVRGASWSRTSDLTLIRGAL